MTNLSYYLLPLIWFQGPYSSSRGPLMRLKKDDNINPRLVLDSLEKSGKLSPRLIAKLRRRESCEKNCWEGLPMILAAVVAGNSVGLSEQWMNAISVGYFLFRCGYIWSYINIETKPASFIRSLFWWAGNLCSIITFIKVGNALNNKVL